MAWRAKIHNRSGCSSVFLDADFSRVLTEVVIDDYEFKVTMHPVLEGRSVLWFRNNRNGAEFEALGQFSRFDKRDVLFFISRYATSAKLRGEIDNRRFERRLDGLTREFFADVARRSKVDRTTAFRTLFNLDDQIDPGALAARRKIMARRFHPDAGGDDATMSLINQAYEHLVETAVSKRH